MATRIECQAPDCNYSIEHASEAVAIAQYNSHQIIHQRGANNATLPAMQKAPRMDRPSVAQGISEEVWNNFARRWELFKKCTTMCADETTAQLFQCCDDELGNQLLKEDPAIISSNEGQIITAMKRLAVIPVAISVRRAELLQMQQSHGESARSFYAKVKGKAATCNYIAKCTCNPPTDVDFTASIVRDVVVAGISDTDIRKDVLGWPDVDEKPVLDVIAFIESKEMARNALTGGSLAASISGFKKLKNNTPQSPDNKKAKCPDCSKFYYLFSEGARGWNSKPHRLCLDCWKKDRLRSKIKYKKTFDANNRSDDHTKKAETGVLIMKIGAFETDTNIQSHTTLPKDRRSQKHLHSLELNHHIFTHKGWIAARELNHPTIRVRMTTDKDDYKKFNANFPQIAPAYIQVITDTGAQSCLWSRNGFENNGFRLSDLIPVRYSMKAANKSHINIDGAIIVRLQGASSDGNYHECAVMVYISQDANGFYLSREAMTQLGIIPKNFPQIGAAFDSSVSSNKVELIASNTNLPCEESDCGCPKRKPPPKPPSSLPFPCIPENNKRMKEWLIERYSASTFNTCPHAPLPDMKGPPISVHIDPKAKPIAAHTPATIPIHWKDQVEKDLLRDEALKVIERVPHGEPVTWCHRMVITRKHDGGPRRTVDLSPLNKYCTRETHAMKSPFQLARSVPPNTWKTVTDAWNGYHSVPIKEEDRHLTTFITPIGRWRYRKAPQGFLSSGDGYNRRFDEIVADFPNKQRCVDDTLHHDLDLTKHWWRTIEFLELLGKAGIVLNSKKFQFAEQTVDFAGFRISNSGVEPLPKYIDAIRNFPTPSSITDVRSWFGLVNQVSHYAQLREIMTPFKNLLSPKCKFMWSETLNKAFHESKEHIIDAIKSGVEIFDITLKTCLRTDWSKTGVGYYLCQKHCNCVNQAPGCCDDGWRITLAGSRFLNAAEQRYAPVEGEMLAVAWALEQTKYFTQGCDNLLVITDHKPLVKLLGDRTLDEITNTRLFRLKQRTLMWKFSIEHQPGTENWTADATSRHPSESTNDQINIAGLDLRTPNDNEEMFMIAGIRNDINKLHAVTWQRLQKANQEDCTMKELLTTVEGGFPKEKNQLQPSLLPFWEYRKSLFTSDGVVLYKDRAIIPPALRSEILEILHSAHQGVSGMTARAHAAVFWPGITCDIQEVRNRCHSCNKNAPSQARMPPVIPHIPTTPFEAIFADYFDFQGWHYLVIGDRLSGWTEICRVKTGTMESGAKGLGMSLRRLFVTFGVPEELSSDGGPEFTANETRDFLQRWGIHHRISSAHHPQSNGRAELAVKATKRLLENNLGPGGDLNTDAFVRAMLTLRNTPDIDCKLSPAEILFGHPLRDALPRIEDTKQKFDNDEFLPMWREIWAAKESALRTRYAKTIEALQEHSQPLPPLRHGHRVYIQNQDGNNPKKWDRSGTVVECRDNDQYAVKVDGTGRLTLRNRRFLRMFKPHSMYVDTPATFHTTTLSQPANLTISTPHCSSNNDQVPTYDQQCSSPTELGHVPPTHSDQLSQPPIVFSSPSQLLEPSDQPSSQTGTEADTTVDHVTPLRRSTRIKTQKCIYDPDSGTYINPNPK